MSRIIVTGATGHIGNIIVEKLTKNGQDVTCLVLPNDNCEQLQTFHCQIVRGDVTDFDCLKNLIKIDDIVIHLAGIISISKKNADLINKVNYLGTKNIADICLKNKARLIFVSTVDILNNEIPGLVSETNGFKQKFRSPYEESKYKATEYVFNLFNKGLKGLVIYPSAVVGPYDNSLGEVSNALIMLYKRKMPAYIKGGYSFVDARDVADGIISAALNQNLNNKGYILANDYISVKELMKTVYDHYGYKHLPGYCPLFLVYLGLPFIALYAKIAHKKPIFTKVMLKTILANGHFDSSLAIKDLNFKVRPLKESIIDSIEWLKSEHKELF